MLIVITATQNYASNKGVKEANWIMQGCRKLGISIDKVTQQLEDEGVKKFDEPFDKLMETLTKKSAQ